MGQKWQKSIFKSAKKGAKNAFFGRFSGKKGRF
jgi:hypothetical protein